MQKFHAVSETVPKSTAMATPATRAAAVAKIDKLQRNGHLLNALMAIRAKVEITEECSGSAACDRALAVDVSCGPVVGPAAKRSAL